MLVKDKSNALFDEIDRIKEALIESTGGYSDDDPEKPKKMNNREKVAELMVKGTDGEALKKQIDDYRDFMITTAGDNDQLATSITKVLSTEVVKNEDGISENWVSHNFEHYPLISVLSTLTTIQSNVRNSEAQTIDMLQDNISADDLGLTDVMAMVIPNSKYITYGQAYEAQVMLAAYDATQQPRIFIEDKELETDKIVNGIGMVNMAFPVGEHTWGGKIIIRDKSGVEKEYKIAEQSFTVAPPSVVISPSKMNVLYRSVYNPLEISVPGVDPSKVSASGPGVRRTGSGYIADVTKIKGKLIKINVTVTNDDGTTTSMGSKEFRIKGLPQARGLFLKKSTTIASINAIKSQPIEAAYEDFPFDLPLQVTGFELKIGGQPPIKIRGNRLDATSKRLVERLKTGSTITIRKITAKTPKGTTVSKIGIISIDVN